MEIIPAIDIIDGKCVRLTRGDYSTVKVYDEDPVEVARRFEGAGLKRLHLVDLDGAAQKRVVNLRILERIAGCTGLWIDFGGGIQSDADLSAVFDAGARQVTGGSIALKDPERFAGWMETWGPERIILGADVRSRKVAVGAWTENSDTDVMDLIRKYTRMGLRFVISTDVDRDGALAGPAFELYSEIQQAFPELGIIASGGVARVEDLVRLKGMGLFGVILGKAIYEGRISLEQLSELIA